MAPASAVKRRAATKKVKTRTSAKAASGKKSKRKHQRTTEKRWKDYMKVRNHEMMALLKCNEAELEQLKWAFKAQLEKTLVGGKPFLGQLAADIDASGTIRDQMWQRVADTKKTFKDILGGSRYKNGVPPSFNDDLLKVKKKILSDHNARVRGKKGAERLRTFAEHTAEHYGEDDVNEDGQKEDEEKMPSTSKHLRKRKASDLSSSGSSRVLRSKAAKPFTSPYDIIDLGGSSDQSEKELLRQAKRRRLRGGPTRPIALSSSDEDSSDEGDESSDEEIEDASASIDNHESGVKSQAQTNTVLNSSSQAKSLHVDDLRADPRVFAGRRNGLGQHGKRLSSTNDYVLPSTETLEDASNRTDELDDSDGATDVPARPFTKGKGRAISDASDDEDIAESPPPDYGTHHHLAHEYDEANGHGCEDVYMTGQDTKGASHYQSHGSTQRPITPRFEASASSVIYKPWTPKPFPSKAEEKAYIQARVSQELVPKLTQLEHRMGQLEPRFPMLTPAVRSKLVAKFPKLCARMDPAHTEQLKGILEEEVRYIINYQVDRALRVDTIAKLNSVLYQMEDEVIGLDKETRETIVAELERGLFR